jgi:hypothetical protein
MDDVKFSKNSMYARNRIMLEGRIETLTVPTSNSSKNETIKDVKICDDKWRRRHAGMIRQAYGKSRHYEEFMTKIEGIYARRWDWLVDLNHEVLRILIDIFRIGSSIKVASEFEFSGDKNTRLISYCSRFGADEYLFGKNGRKYADEDAFLRNGIKVSYQDFTSPTTKLSFIDHIFNFGASFNAISR